jgi:hypothetical protein
MNAGVRRRELPRTRVMSRSRGLVLGGTWLRCTTRWRVRELDRQLAAGVDPMQSDELSLRVGQLGSPRNRSRIACGLPAATPSAFGASRSPRSSSKTDGARCIATTRAARSP